MIVVESTFYFCYTRNFACSGYPITEGNVSQLPQVRPIGGFIFNTRGRGFESSHRLLLWNDYQRKLLLKRRKICQNAVTLVVSVTIKYNSKGIPNNVGMLVEPFVMAISTWLDNMVH